MLDRPTYLMQDLSTEALISGDVRRALWRKEGEGKDLACALELAARVRAMLSRLAEGLRELANDHDPSASASWYLASPVSVESKSALLAQSRKIHPFGWASMNKQAR